MKTGTCSKIAIAIISLAIAGCATCRAHPTGCEVAGVIVAGVAIGAVGAAQANQRHGFWESKP